MRCPQDVDVDLVRTERQGVEIDYCPSCRGVWLDRGELDKILDRAAQQSPVARAAGPAPVAHAYDAGYPAKGGFASGPYPSGGGYRDDDRRSDRGDDRPRYEDRPRYDEPRHEDDRRRYDEDRSGHDRHGHDPRRKRKESWLGDLLDFG